VATEFELINRYFSPPTRHTLLAGGDDAALIAVRPGTALAVSTDMLVSGRHFRGDADAAGVGHKSLAVNLSDMAAMGACPRWFTLSLALPAGDERWIEAFMEGLLALADSHDVDLIGGDTTRGPLAICIQIMGEVEPGAALLRSGARVGDDLWVSGSVGDAAVALLAARGEIRLTPAHRTRAEARLDRPQPRVALGLALVGIAHGCIDVSDGLVADVGHVAERSGVAAVIDWARVPLSAEASALRDHPAMRQAALSGGDDYELAFTAASDQRDNIDALSARLGLALTRVGRIEAGSGVTVVDATGRALELAEAGYDHFG
jgi:thiamine-monophosphate kinase